jgi:hypothetical protein
LVDLFDPSRVIVTDPLMLMCDGLAVRGGATSTGEYSRAVKWGIALRHTAIAQDLVNRTGTLGNEDYDRPRAAMARSARVACLVSVLCVCGEAK